MITFLTAGESHGPAETAIIEGMPAGLSLTREIIQHDLDKRKGGYGRGGRGKIETDSVKILSGVRLGKTLGSPITLQVENMDFANWSEKMSVHPLETDIVKVTNPRPGHADLAGTLKYQTDDIRNILERASARETIMRVAIGAVCRAFLQKFGIEIYSHTLRIGSVTANSVLDHPDLFSAIKTVYETDPDIRCTDKNISEQMKEEIRQTTMMKDTLGGVIEICAANVPVGLGSHVHWQRKLDAKLAEALMSIPSVKAVETGDGILNASRTGSNVQDEIFYEKNSYSRKSNRNGGIEGGISNGEMIVCRIYHKPIATLNNPLDTVNMQTKKPEKALIERSDVCIIPRAGIIAESMVAIVLANAMLEKYGGDHIEETKRNFDAYQKWIKEH